MKYFLIFTILHICQADDDKPNYNLIVRRIANEIDSIVTPNMNKSIYNDYVLNNPTCLEKLTQIWNSNYTDPMVDQIVYNSGKGIADLGSEKTCTRDGFGYYLIRFNLNLTNYYAQDDKSIDLYTFLQQFSFYTGFCLIPECEEFYTRFCKFHQNGVFFKYLEGYGIKGISLFHTDMNNYENSYFCIVLWAIFGYVVLILFISGIGVLYYKKDEYIHHDSISMYSEYSDDSSKLSSVRPNIFKANAAGKKRDKNILYRIYKFFSIRTNIKSLFDFKNKTYNDQGLEIVCFVRCFVLFWLTFNHNIYTLISIPHRDSSTNHFVSSFWFVLVKYSVYAIDSWIILDGLVFAYKLMCFLKKTNDYSLRNFLTFYCSAISRIIVFFAIFFLLYILFNDIGRFIGKTSLFEYFFGNMNRRLCKHDPLMLVIPFYLQYFAPSDGMAGCYRHVYVLQNELICMTFMMIVIYFGYRFKTRAMDYIILISMPLLVFSNYFFTDEARHSAIMDRYTYFIVSGNTLHYKKTHIFFFEYYIGMLIGMIYFYYKDVITQQPMGSIHEYMPFFYASDLMKSFDSMDNCLKYSILYLSIIGQIGLSFSYHIFRHIYGSGDTLAFELNDFMILWFLYEKYIYVLFFMIMMLSFLVYPKQTFFKPLIETTFFIPIYRASFCYFNILNSMVYLFYSIYSLQIYFNYQNTMFMTIGLIVIQMFASIMLMLLFEIPFKRLSRYMLSRGRKEKIK
jgi:hypothetical protein